MPTKQTNPDRDPNREIHERIAETVPGLTAAAHAVGLEDHRRMLKHHADRVRSSFEMGQEILTGEKPGDSMSDEMGDIVITGDIQVMDNVQAGKVLDSLRGREGEQPTTQPIPEPIMTSKPPTNWIDALPKLAIAALGIGGGTALPIIAYNMTKPAIVAPADTNTDTTAIVYPGFGKPTPVEKDE